MTAITQNIEQARAIAATTPAGESPSLTDHMARRGLIADIEEKNFIAGWEAGRKSMRFAEKVQNFGDAVCWFALGSAIGLAVALYVIAPAF